MGRGEEVMRGEKGKERRGDERREGEGGDKR